VPEIVESPIPPSWYRTPRELFICPDGHVRSADHSSGQPPYCPDCQADGDEQIPMVRVEFIRDVLAVALYLNLGSLEEVELDARLINTTAELVQLRTRYAARKALEAES
jgi:hypothetical protein